MALFRFNGVLAKGRGLLLQACCMADEINLEAGDEAENVIAGKKNQQQSNRSDPRQQMRGGDTYYGENNSQQWITAQILDHAQQLRELTRLLDDIPYKISRLENKVDIQVEKIKKLEDLEVVVRKEEVIIRPVPPPDAANVPTRILLIVLVFAFVFLVAVVSYLVYLQAVANA